MPEFARADEHQRRKPECALRNYGALIAVDRAEQSTNVRGIDYRSEMFGFDRRKGASEVRRGVALCAFGDNRKLEDLVATLKNSMSRLYPLILAVNDLVEGGE